MNRRSLFSLAPATSQADRTATLTYGDCDRLKMQRRFGAANVVKPSQNRNDTLNLERIGACR